MRVRGFRKFRIKDPADKLHCQVAAAVIVGAATVAGGAMASSGAKNAARTQANAAGNASEVQRDIFNQVNAQQQPYIQSGYGAQLTLNRLLGFGGSPQPSGGYSAGPNAFPQSGTGIRIGGPNDAGVRMQPRLSVDGGREPVRYPNGSLNEAGDRMAGGRGPGFSGNSGNTFDMSRGADGSYSMGGNTGLPDGYLTQTFGPEQFAEGIDPGYGWRFQQGLQAVSNGAAPSIGSLSGPALKALMDYGQGEASQEYGAAFNRFQTQQGNIFQRLSAVASLGQNAAAGVGNQGIATGQSIGANIVGAGNASAAGQIGSANAWSNTANNLGSIAYLAAKK
jgi:hypothetical protein